MSVNINDSGIVIARNQQLFDELGTAPGAAGSEIEIPPHY